LGGVGFGGGFFFFGCVCVVVVGGGGGGGWGGGVFGRRRRVIEAPMRLDPVRTSFKRLFPDLPGSGYGERQKTLKKTLVKGSTFPLKSEDTDHLGHQARCLVSRNKYTPLLKEPRGT